MFTTHTPTKEKRAIIQSQIDATSSHGWLNIELPHQRDYKTLRDKLKRTCLRAVYWNGYPVVYKDGSHYKVYVKISKKEQNNITITKLDNGLVCNVKILPKIEQEHLLIKNLIATQPTFNIVERGCKDCLNSNSTWCNSCGNTGYGDD